MSRDPRFDPLFEPLRIGPVIAPNRFYQVPHCSGMGYSRPQMMAAMRGTKAEALGAERQRREDLLSGTYVAARLEPVDVPGHRGPVMHYTVGRKLGPGPEHDYVFVPRV